MTTDVSGNSGLDGQSEEKFYGFASMDVLLWKYYELQIRILTSGRSDIEKIKGPRPYSSCHAKRQNDVLAGWVGKNYPLVTFSPWQDEYSVLCFVFSSDLLCKIII